MKADVLISMQARRYRLNRILATERNRQPINILYCIDGSSYDGWQFSIGFLIHRS